MTLLSVGRLKISFSFSGRSRPQFLKKRYGPYLTARGRGVPVEVSRLSGRGGGPLDVRRKKGGISISRRDFRSLTPRGKGPTALEVSFNKYSFDSWLRIFTTFLALGENAALLHAAGISAEGGALVFPGKSGAGKSTSIRKFGRKAALSDELVLVGAGGKKATASSTPFWGELRMGRHTPRTVPLKALYFLKKGGMPSIRILDRSEAFRRLMGTALFFSKDPADVKKLLKVCADICAAVPAYELAYPLSISGKELYDRLQKNS